MSDIFGDYSFGGWLRHIRVESRITLRELGRRTGDIGASNLSKLERSELTPPRKAKKIDELCAALGKPERAEFLKSLAFQHHLSDLIKEFNQ